MTLLGYIVPFCHGLRIERRVGSEVSAIDPFVEAVFAAPAAMVEESPYLSVMLCASGVPTLEDKMGVVDTE